MQWSFSARTAMLWFYLFDHCELLYLFYVCLKDVFSEPLRYEAVLSIQKNIFSKIRYSNEKELCVLNPKMHSFVTFYYGAN